MDLEAVWEMRETQVYPDLFGPKSRGIFALSPQLFAERFRQGDIDPRWITHGVFEFAPTPERASWLYVTSGLSNPWEQEPEDWDPAGPSGAGVEFVLQVTRPGDWAVRMLQNMLAFELLLRAGRYPKGAPLAPDDRIPLREPLDGRPACRIRHLVVTQAEGVAPGFALPSGQVRLLGFTGLTDDELAFAQHNGSPALIERLRRAGFHPVTDPVRPSLIRRT
ncbi:suppressor of fused domain protein [Caulobacter sp. 17J65-9]|uniref:suppressor of fused domain protein n=1 Tax=Caulobacter sp. 17J65-9 TaxID=2709382 RepID=UPI0013CB9984|nr:suppressor of fused domain protein [Caulobacter sp. 17J65-9]NEX93207.1 suppressor of fused domain protein [Caulobacter sp. 17J65-9]